MKSKLLLVMSLFFLLSTLSCSEKDVSFDLIKKIRTDQAFRNLWNSNIKFQSDVQNKNIAFLVKDRNDALVWESKIRNAKNESDSRVLLDQVCTNSQLLINFYSDFSKNLSVLKNSLPELKKMSNEEFVSVVKDSFKEERDENLKMAKVALVGDCYGGCSEALNIALDYANNALVVATIGCGLLSAGVVTGIMCGIGATFTYGFAVNAAIDTFGTCWKTCTPVEG